MRHLTLALLCAAVMLAATGCRKKSSPEYYDAEGRHSVLVARSGDDAYLEPEMQTVLGLLDRVPENAREAEKAGALKERIKSEIARVQKANEVRDRAIENAGAPTAGGPSFGGTALQPIQPAAAQAAGGDAGPVEEKPAPGMAEADFKTKFGACMESGTSLPIPGEKEAGTMYMVLQAPDCQKKYGVTGGKLAFVFSAGKLRGTMVRSEVKSTVIVDAGVQPVVVGVIDAGVTYVLPGAPIPQGYTLVDSGT